MHITIHPLLLAGIITAFFIHPGLGFGIIGVLTIALILFGKREYW